MHIIKDKKLLSMWEGDYYKAVMNNGLENKGQALSIIVHQNNLYLHCVGGLVKSPARLREGESSDIEEVFYQTPTSGHWEAVDIV